MLTWCYLHYHTVPPHDVSLGSVQLEYGGTKYLDFFHLGRVTASTNFQGKISFDEITMCNFNYTPNQTEFEPCPDLPVAFSSVTVSRKSKRLGLILTRNQTIAQTDSVIIKMTVTIPLSYDNQGLTYRAQVEVCKSSMLL